MAYGLRYQSIYSNDLQQDVTVNLYQKDYVGDLDAFIVADKMELTDTSDENTIIARAVSMAIWADSDTDITWETFLAGAYDEWKMEVIIDSRKFFEGFLTPEEGSSAFLDKPYEVNLRATNGLKLLKDVPLTNLSGVNFKGKFTASDFITAALQKTLLDLPIRMYGSIYNEDMDNRDDDPQAIFWNQIKFDHRAFLKDATTFLSCYDALLFMLGRAFRISYFDGRWVIFYLPEHQYAPAGLWYTDFDSAGVVTGGAEDTEGYATVGKAEAIYPINEDQLISSSFAIKNARTNFNYNIWPEIPLNSKFQRGTLIGTGTDADGNPYEDYTIDDWTSGTYQGNPTEYSDLPAITVANPDPWYVRRTFNIYGIELRREVIIERDTAAGGRFVQSEGIPVNAGDVVRFSFDWKASVDLGTGDPVPVQLTPYIVQDVTLDKYVLRSKDGLVSEVKWEPSTPSMTGIYTTPNGDLTAYQSVSAESPIIPINGTLYILMWSSVALGDNSQTFYKGLSMEYIPYIGGGFIPVSGDFWQHTQNANQLDKDEGEIKISDTIIRVAQGCMLNADGLTATTPTWYRQGETESRHFKELVNLGRYNLGYQRFWSVEGSFTGLLYSPVNDQLAFQPLTYHKNYQFSDLPQVRQFILAPQLTMNLCTGNVKAIFEEVYNPALEQNYGADYYRVSQAIIQMVLAEFGHVLSRVPPQTTLFKLISTAGDTVSASAAANGAGNTPLFEVNTQFDDAGVHVSYLSLGEDIEIDNIFTVTINAVPHSFTVIDIILQSDGTQPGDTQEFNYIFKRN